MKVWRVAAGMVAIALIGVVFVPAVCWSQTEYLITANQTDQEIDEWLQPHVIEIDRTAQPQDLLVVHFPGSFDVPTNSKLVLQHAARRGYPAIGLRYPNSWTVNSLCSSSTDPDCFEKVRMEILDGTDRTDILSVTEANSITNRLVKLLQYLESEFPDDDWGRFLSAGGDVMWSKIVVAATPREPATRRWLLTSTGSFESQCLQVSPITVRIPGSRRPGCRMPVRHRSMFTTDSVIRETPSCRWTG